MARTETDSAQGDENSWRKLALELKPGDRRPETTVCVQGSAILYACQLSSSFGIFTMRTENDGENDCDDSHTTTNRLDVVLKKDDGWDPTEISTMMDHILSRTIDDDHQHFSVEGFLERCRAKSEQGTSPICIHAQVLTIRSICGDGQEEIMQWKRPTTEIPTPMTNDTPLPSNQKGSSGGWRGAKDDTRFSKFVAFLLENFGGYEKLSAKPIMDIAGGAGGLAFELSVRHAMACIVVDTKPLRFKAKQVRHVNFRKDCVERLQAQPNMEESPLAQNLLRRFQVDCDLETLQVNQLQTLLDSKQVLHTPETQGGKDFKQDVAAERLRSILQNKQCSILCGMHPDQATDHIIDIGLALNIPWAVVPCCVFPNLFRMRKTYDVKSVRSYEDFCDFIRCKHRGITEADLPFRGRNKVLYWIPPGWK